MEKQIAVLCGSLEKCDYQIGIYNDECSNENSRNCPYANHQDYFRRNSYFVMDEKTQYEIADVISAGEQCTVIIHRGIREIWFRGTEGIELRLLFLGCLRLTISRVAFENQRCRTMSKILDLLIEFCRRNEIQEIVAQSVETPEMAAFCLKHHFQPDVNVSMEMDGILMGDYRLKISNEL